MSKLDELLKTVPRLFRRAPGERHFVVNDKTRLLEVCAAARQEGCWLVSLLACDERTLEDRAFKVYCVLSECVPFTDDPRRGLITLEHPLGECEGKPTWYSIRRHFGGARPLERELADLFGIAVVDPPEPEHAPQGQQGNPGAGRAVLVGDYHAGDYFPLRRDAPARPERQTGGWVSLRSTHPTGGAVPHSETLAEGVMIMPVGPIHAGVIQPGYFAFHIAGEVVEQLPVQLGYTHRGVERLFERRRLLDGWDLAERVAGDSAFAHSLAYCQAVESLAGVEVSKLPPRVWLWRGLLLELERLCNHLADCAAMVHDMAFDALSSPMTVLQENLVRLGADLTGHRLLRGVNRPGGVAFPEPARAAAALEGLSGKVTDLVDRFLDLALCVIELPACRDRLISTGVLTRTEALDLGATGLPARASGLIERDFRLRHPQGIYGLGEVQAEILQTTQPAGHEDWTRRVPVRDSDLSGDCFARTLLRLAESETSARIIGHVAKKLLGLSPTEPYCIDPIEFDERLRRAHNFDFGLGYAEGWRGEVCYWIMKGPHRGIFRCKVRDPSVFNWPALARAVERKPWHPGEPGSGPYHENILADFPLINKSFNLSYAGTDL